MPIRWALDDGCQDGLALCIVFARSIGGPAVFGDHGIGAWMDAGSFSALTLILEAAHPRHTFLIVLAEVAFIDPTSGRRKRQAQAKAEREKEALRALKSGRENGTID